MTDFIYRIMAFVLDIFVSIGKATTRLNNSSLDNGPFLTNYMDFMSKNVFSDNSLIGINLTWNDLFIYVSTIALTIFFIVFFVNIVFKVIKLICIR